MAAAPSRVCDISGDSARGSTAPQDNSGSGGNAHIRPRSVLEGLQCPRARNAGRRPVGPVQTGDPVLPVDPPRTFAPDGPSLPLLGRFGELGSGPVAVFFCRRRIHDAGDVPRAPENEPRGT